MATEQDIKGFKSYLSERNIPLDKATGEDIKGFRAMQAPTQSSVVAPTETLPTEAPVVAPVETPVETPIVAPKTDVTLKSGETQSLSDSELQLRAKNLQAQGIQADTQVAKETGGVIMNQKEEFELGESKKQATKQEEQAKIEGFRRLMEENADRAEMAKFVNENPGLRAEFGIQVKNFYKNKQNFDFQQKYATASPKTLYDAYINSDIVVGSAEYNMLPPETKSAFEQYKAQRDITMTTEDLETSLSNDKTKILEAPVSNKPVFSGTDIRATYDKLINAPEMSSKRTEVEGLANELGTLQNDINAIEDDILAEYEGSGRSQSFINAKIAKEQRVLQKQYNNVSVQYQNSLASFQDMKSDVEREMKYVEFEEQRAFQNYQIQLGQYNADRSRMDTFAMAEFERKNNEIATQKQQQFTREMAQFQLDNKGGDYIDDGNGNLMYVVDGEIKGQLNGLGKKISTQATDDYTFESFEADDGTITTLIRNKKTGQINSDVRNTNGDQPGDYFNSLGNGKITGYGGAYDKNEGLDIDGNVGDPVYAPFDGEIVEAMSHPMYGNTIVVEDPATGNKIRYSHLDSSIINNVGTKFQSGAVIAALGNSGNVLKMNGQRPTQAELKAGFGSHLDIVTYDENGRPRSSRETETYLKNISNQAKKVETYNSSFGPLYAKFNSDKSLTAADWKAIPNTEQFMKEAEIYGAEKAIPGYDKIERLIGIANSIKDKTRGERIGASLLTNPDLKADITRLKDKAGMQELINLKSQGATFGSLTETEFERIQNSILLLNPLMSEDKWNEILDDFVLTMTDGLPTNVKENFRGNVGGNNTPVNTGKQIFTPTTSGFNYTPSTNLDPAITSFFNQ